MFSFHLKYLCLYWSFDQGGSILKMYAGRKKKWFTLGGLAEYILEKFQTT